MLGQHTGRLLRQHLQGMILTNKGACDKYIGFASRENLPDGIEFGSEVATSCLSLAIPNYQEPDYQEPVSERPPH